MFAKYSDAFPKDQVVLSLIYITISRGTRKTNRVLAQRLIAGRADRNVSIDYIARIARGLEVDPWKLLKMIDD
jgi:hypothetical protein